MKKINSIGILLPLLLPLVACQQPASQNEVTSLSITTQSLIPLKGITSFETNDIQVDVSAADVELNYVNQEQSQGVTAGKQALKVDFLATQAPEPSVTLTPKAAWQWHELGDFRIALDITNSTDIATHLFVQIGNEQGQVHNRSVNIPANTSNTYHIELKSIDLDIESGIRSNPLAWQSTETPFIWRWG
ncbi:hypothetical protein [Thalassotalea agariperforans]